MSEAASERPDVNEHGRRLVELLEEQRDCYQELKRLAARQRRMITDRDPEALLKVLAERQGLVHRLNGLNEALQPFRQDWANTYGQMPSARRRHVQEVLDEINMLLGSILLTDAEDSRLLTASKEEVRGQMMETASGRTANAAYAAQAYQASGPVAADHEA